VTEERPCASHDCPYCGVRLDALPKTKKACPACGRPIYVRAGPDEVRYLFRDGDLEAHEARWAEYQDRRWWIERAAELLEARELLRADGREVELIEPEGDPAMMIEQIAEKGGYDTVVVGSRDPGSIGRMIAGSVSEHVATYAKTTVIVAR